MTANVQNANSFLPNTRSFPRDAETLSEELSKTYLDIATQVNARTLGTFGYSAVLTGETWYLTGSNNKKQTYRKVFKVTGAGNIAHGINISNIAGFTRIYGTFTNGTNWYPLPYVDVVAANNQISISITSTNIVITAGAGAPPAITSGTVILEWLQ